MKNCGENNKTFTNSPKKQKAVLYTDIVTVWRVEEWFLWGRRDIWVAFLLII